VPNSNLNFLSKFDFSAFEENVWSFGFSNLKKIGMELIGINDILNLNLFVFLAWKIPENLTNSEISMNEKHDKLAELVFETTH